MKHRVLLAVDLSNQVYKACHVNQGLMHEGIPTGGLFGFIMGVSAAIHKVGATDLIVCSDRPPYRRSDLYPQYKMLRKEAEDPELRARVRQAKEQISELARTTGMVVWGVPGFECDDLIGHIVRVHGWRYDMVVAMSSDRDLMQLLDHPRFRIYLDAKSPLRTVKCDDLMGLTPAQYVHALCLSGTHNDVEGLPGIGPVKSSAMVRDPVKWRQAQATHQALLARNVQLIRLPHADFPDSARMPYTERNRFDLRALYRFAGRYGINITSTMANAFEQVLT